MANTRNRQLSKAYRWLCEKCLIMTVIRQLDGQPAEIFDIYPDEWPTYKAIYGDKIKELI